MNLIISDQNNTDIAVIDHYQSLIWTERYRGSGDFELVIPASSEAIGFLKKDYYVSRPGSDRTMIIETLKLETNPEEGDVVIASGRSLESILDRRIVWNQTVIEGNLQNGVQKLINENIISPSESGRAIPNFVFLASDDADVSGYSVDAQYDGDSLYDAVYDMCRAAGLGFRVTFNTSYQLVFQLYSGKDRSYNQSVNPYVIFSPEFDNLLNSNYLTTSEPYRNAALVAGEGEGSERKRVSVVSENNISGLNRREIYVDAKSVSSKTDDGELGEEEYSALLRTKGVEALAEKGIQTAFDGEAIPEGSYTYGTDYGIGDIVQIENNYGMQAVSRVTEFIISDSEEGYNEYPTFSAVD